MFSLKQERVLCRIFIIVSASATFLQNNTRQATIWFFLFHSACHVDPVLYLCIALGCYIQSEFPILPKILYLSSMQQPLVDNQNNKWKCLTTPVLFVCIQPIPPFFLISFIPRIDVVVPCYIIFKIAIKCDAPILRSSTLNMKFREIWSYAAVSPTYTAINVSLYLSITDFRTNIGSVVQQLFFWSKLCLANVPIACFLSPFKYNVCQYSTHVGSNGKLTVVLCNVEWTLFMQTCDIGKYPDYW